MLWTAMQGQPGRWWGLLITRLVELVLIVLGLAFVLGPDDGQYTVEHLLNWDILAVAYLLLGTVLLHRSRRESPEERPRDLPRLLRWTIGRRYSVLFTLAASVTGVTAAISVVLADDQGATGDILGLLAVVAIITSWMLLHAGYARVYNALYHQPGGGGFDFPKTSTPQRVDLVYFAFTIGTSFAASDVSVTTREMRWHVTVHSTLSFFYNTAVLAVAIGIITGN